MKSIKLTKNTNLSELKLPYLSVILDESFLIPEAKEIKTIGDLSLKSGVSLDETRRRLEEFRRLSNGIEYDNEKPSSLQDFIYLDVSAHSSKAELKPEYTPAISLWEENFQKILPSLKEQESKILVLSKDGKRGFSAAMYLRRLGFKNIFIMKSPHLAYCHKEKSD